MRRAVAAFLAVFVLARCAGTEPTVEPGTGPAAEASEATEPSATAEPSTSEEPEDLEPGPDPTTDPLEEETEERVEEATASFGERYVYPDGVEVEITRVRHGKLPQSDWKDYYEDEPAPDYVMVSLRVRNKSKKRIEVSDIAEINYGPDGTQAGRYGESGSIDGPLLPGRAKTSVNRVFIPKKHQDDVVWAQGIDYEREQVIFVGSLAKDLN